MEEFDGKNRGIIMAFLRYDGECSDLLCQFGECLAVIEMDIGYNIKKKDYKGNRMFSTLYNKAFSGGEQNRRLTKIQYLELQKYLTEVKEFIKNNEEKVCLHYQI